MFHIFVYCHRSALRLMFAILFENLFVTYACLGCVCRTCGGTVFQFLCPKDSIVSREVSLLLDRLEKKFDTCFVDNRPATSYKEGLRIHQSCGLFIHMLERLEALAPSKGFPSMKKGLMEQFVHSYLDADLAHVIEHTVPPADLSAIGAFRRPVGPLAPAKNGSLSFEMCWFSFGLPPSISKLSPTYDVSKHYLNSLLHSSIHLFKHSEFLHPSIQSFFWIYSKIILHSPINAIFKHILAYFHQDMFNVTSIWLKMFLHTSTRCHAFELFYAIC